MNIITNKELHDEARASQISGQITDRMFELICEMVNRVYIVKYGKHNLSFKPEMLIYAIEKASYDSLRFCTWKVTEDDICSFYLKQIKSYFLEYIVSRRKAKVDLTHD